MKSLKKTIISHASRYLFAGIGIYIFDFLIFSLFILFDPALYLWGNVMGRLSGALAGFFIHRHWTFKGEQKHRAKKQFIMYVSLLGVNILASSVLLYLIIDVGQLTEILARIMTDIIVITFAFFISRIFVFSHK